MQIDSLDHLVLTVASITVTTDFYRRVLAMDVETFGAGRTALRFGVQKINLHQAGQEFEPKAEVPTSGSGDLCFLTSTPMDSICAHLAAEGVAVLEGPVQRTGAEGPILSIYFRDPDGNLVEVSNSLISTGAKAEAGA